MSLWIDHDTGGDDYMAARHGLGTLYSGLTDAQKTNLLTTAQMMLEYSRRFAWRDANELLVKESEQAIYVTQPMKDAVCEQAIFLLLDPDMEKRTALVIQGVVSSSVVNESYAGRGGEIPICPAARMILANNSTLDYRNPSYNSFDIVR